MSRGTPPNPRPQPQERPKPPPNREVRDGTPYPVNVEEDSDYDEWNIDERSFFLGLMLGLGPFVVLLMCLVIAWWTG